MKKFIIIIFCFSFILSVQAQNPNLGSSGAQFLEIPVGAKAAAMGSAFVGVSDDATSIFWNPAGLTNISNNAAHFSHMRWFDMFDFSAASLVFNMGEMGTVAAGVIIFAMDETEITTEFEPNGTGRYYDASDLAVSISYAKKISDRFSVGITGKYIQQSIWNETASGVAFDVGTQYKIDFQNLVIAMSMRNFGAELQFEGEDLNVVYDKNDQLPQNRLTPAKLVTDPYPIPLVFQVGIAFDVFKNDFIHIRGGIDAVHPNDNEERINCGTEIGFFDRFFIRGGYKYNYDDEDFAFGAGVNLPVGMNRIGFDYAYSVFDILPSVHRISLSVEF